VDSTEQDVWRSDKYGNTFSEVGRAIEVKRWSAVALSFSGSIFLSLGIALNNPKFASRLNFRSSLARMEAAGKC
jgi:hypothetical protein